jgi:hypothetical protein
VRYILEEDDGEAFFSASDSKKKAAEEAAEKASTSKEVDEIIKNHGRPDLPMTDDWTELRSFLKLLIRHFSYPWLTLLKHV